MNDANDNTGIPNMTVVTTTAPITSNIASFILFLLFYSVFPTWGK